MGKKKKKGLEIYEEKRNVASASSLRVEDQGTYSDYETSGNISQTLGEDDTLVAESENDAMELGENVAQSAQVEHEQSASGRETAEGQMPKQSAEHNKCNLGPAMVDYVGAVKKNRKAPNGIALDDARPAGKHFNPEEIDIEEGVVEDFDLNTAYYLIGHISGKFPGRNAIANYIKDWNCELIFHPSGWIVLKFKTIIERDEVLEKGPHYIYRIEFLLHMMPELFSFRREEICKVPLWVKFPCLPLQLWNKQALSLIASGFGKPMYTDKLTRTRERIAYARVLIEVDVSKERKNSVILNLPNGKKIEQHVIYEYWPKNCTHCMAIGHDVENCHALSKRSKSSHSLHQSNAPDQNLELRNARPAAEENLEREQSVLEQTDKTADASDHNKPAQHTKANSAHVRNSLTAQNIKYGAASHDSAGQTEYVAATVVQQQHQGYDKGQRNRQTCNLDELFPGQGSGENTYCHAAKLKCIASAQTYNSAELISAQENLEAVDSVTAQGHISAASCLGQDNAEAAASDSDRGTAEVAAPSSVKGSAETSSSAAAQDEFNSDNLDHEFCTEQEPHDHDFLVPKKKHRVKSKAVNLHTENMSLGKNDIATFKLSKGISKKRSGKGHVPSTKP